MKALKCDRCGKHFDYNENMDNYILAGNKNIENDDIDIGYEFDLCPECVERLYSFLNDADNNKFYDIYLRMRKLLNPKQGRTVIKIVYEYIEWIKRKGIREFNFSNEYFFKSFNEFLNNIEKDGDFYESLKV